MNVLPLPSSLVAVIQPSWSSMIPWVTLRPSPVPSPTPFVVKKGSKIRPRCVLGDALALVLDLDDGALALLGRRVDGGAARVLRVATVTVPPLGIA